jgi:hypothetical protein
MDGARGCGWKCVRELERLQRAAQALRPCRQLTRVVVRLGPRALSEPVRIKSLSDPPKTTGPNADLSTLTTVFVNVDSPSERGACCCLQFSRSSRAERAHLSADSSARPARRQMRRPAIRTVRANENPEWKSAYRDCNSRLPRTVNLQVSMVNLALILKMTDMSFKQPYPGMSRNRASAAKFCRVPGTAALEAAGSTNNTDLGRPPAIIAGRGGF